MCENAVRDVSELQKLQTNRVQSALLVKKCQKTANFSIHSIHENTHLWRSEAHDRVFVYT